MANRYWVGGTGNWSNVDSWSTSSGGASGAAVPTSSDDVYIDDNSLGAGQTLTLDTDVTVANLYLDSTYATAKLDCAGFDITSVGDIIGGASADMEVVTGSVTLTIGDDFTANTLNLDLTRTTLKAEDNNIGTSPTFDIEDYRVYKMQAVNAHILVVVNNEPMRVGIVELDNGSLQTPTTESYIGRLELKGDSTLTLPYQNTTYLYDITRSKAHAGQALIRGATGGTQTTVRTLEKSYTLDNIELQDIKLEGDGIFYLTSENGTSVNDDSDGNIFIGAKPTVERSKTTAHIYDKTSGVRQAILEKEIAAPVIIYNELGQATQEIELVLKVDPHTIPRSYVTVSNEIKLYEYSPQEPMGLLKYSGYIDSYAIDYQEELLTLYIRSYGSFLAYQVLKDPDVAIYEQTDLTTMQFLYEDGSVGLDVAVAQGFTTSGGASGIDSVKLIFNTNGDTVKVGIYSTLNNAQNATNPLGITTKTISHTGGSNRSISIPFAETITVSASTKYWLRLEILDTTADTESIVYGLNNASGTDLYQESEGSGWGSYGTGELTLTVLETSETTTVAFTSEDPSEMVRDSIDQHINLGGRLQYSPLSVVNTGDTVSYTFNTNTYKEVINKALEIAGDTYQWHIDPAVNLIYFEPTSDTTDYTLSATNDIKNLNVNVKGSELYSDVLFTGGDTGGGSFLYKRYTNATTFSQFGRRYLRYTDGRVTLSATADEISAELLDRYSTEELRVSVTLARDSDDKFSQMKVGDTVRIQGLGETNYTVWDLAIFDQSYWDYDLTQIGSLALRINYLEQSTEYIKLWLGSSPTSQFSILQSTRDDIDTDRALDNPSAPS